MADNVAGVSHSKATASNLIEENSDNDAAMLSSRTLEQQLTDFWKLPAELQHRILFAACELPVIERRTSVGLSTSCTETILSLMKASRSFYAVVTPLLYHHVRLPRPSNLRQFHQTLAARPLLGRMVKSIHIGTDEALPKDWWPSTNVYRNDKLEKLFMLRLASPSSRNASLWKDCMTWLHDRNVDHEDGSEGKALEEAIESALHDLDVHPDMRSYSSASGVDLDHDVWHERALELQAALELYYLEVQRRCHAKQQAMEDSAEAATASRYPHLRIGSHTAAPSASPNTPTHDVFLVSRAQLFERMASPGAPADRFDHVVLFIRSHLDFRAVRGRQFQRGPEVHVEDPDAIPDIDAW